MTSEPRTRTFAWEPPTLDIRTVFANTHPQRRSRGWRYNEGHGVQLSWETAVSWVEHDLLAGSDPFSAHGGRVPVPWPASATTGAPLEDQLSPGGYVGYSRRQLCYIGAKALIGARTRGYDSGLLRFMSMRPSWTSCTPRSGDFGRSVVELLAACAADPTLANGAQGPMILVGKAAAPQSMATTRTSASTAPLRGAVRLCAYDVGTEDALRGLGSDANATVPTAGCEPPQSETSGPGVDFMSGGKRHLPGQALVDISAAFGGGYIYGNVCGLGGGQDERLMVYMPEVTLLVFFLSHSQTLDQGNARPQLRVPFWILGARSLMLGLDGQGRYDMRLEADEDVPFESDLATVDVDAGDGSRLSVQLSSSRPFLAFMSLTQDFLGVPESAHGADVLAARVNRQPRQRQVTSSWFAFGRQVRAWVTAVSPGSYHPSIARVVRALVRSVGSGPWGAGLWWGDSHAFLLASWIGQAIAASDWSGNSARGDVGSGSLVTTPLDYYLYSTFTENPGNQCYMLGRAACEQCAAYCARRPLPATAYWLPDWGFFGGGRAGSASACAGYGSAAQYCGERGVGEVLAAWRGRTALELWDALEARMRAAGDNTSETIFDLLGSAPTN